MEQIKLFIADIDQTLRGRKTRMPGKITIDALQQLKAQGVQLCIASGRPLWQEVESHYEQWGMAEQFDYLIGLNGGEVWSKKDGNVHLFHPLSCEDIEDIITTMDQLDNVNPFIYYDRDVELAEFDDEEMRRLGQLHGSHIEFCKDRSQMWEHPTGKVLIRCRTEENAQRALAYAKQRYDGRFACFLTGPSLLEIQYPDVSKGTGLQFICSDNNISLQNVIAFGDAQNDIEMLKIAGKSVALQNAMDDVKEVTDEITEYTVDEDGVGKYLYTHVLHQSY